MASMLARRINSGETALAPTLKNLGGRLGLLQQNPADWLKGENSGTLSEADIRAELAAQGIIIKDTAGGVEWRYE